MLSPCFTNSLKLDHSSPRCSGTSAWSTNASRNYVDAESSFCRLLAAEPDRPDVLFHVGFARFQQNLWEAAAADFRRCLELKRSWLEAMVYLGLCNWNLGDLSAARHRFDDALTQDPLFIPALRCRTSLALAMGDLSTAPELEAQLADLGSTLPEFCAITWASCGRKQINRKPLSSPTIAR